MGTTCPFKSIIKYTNHNKECPEAKASGEKAAIKQFNYF